MNVAIAAISMVALLTLTVLPGEAQKPPADPIGEYYHQSDIAFKKKDPKMLVSLFDKFAALTFTSKTADGEMIGREQARGTFGASLTGIETISERKTDYANQEKKDNRIIVHLIRTEQYTATDPAGKKHVHKVVVMADHTWIKVNGQLKLESAQTKSRKHNVDGQEQKD